MADVRCSKCGHFAFPTGVFTKEYKKWDGEVVCDSCYSELTREKESLSEKERSAREEAEKAAAEERLKEKEEKEKIGLIYDLNGCRGRSLRVYENKCVFKVSITIGSILTKNATDGEKTIYYSDVIGVQFKPSGLAIGYLQLETASSAGNNKSDNFFNKIASHTNLRILRMMKWRRLSHTSESVLKPVKRQRIIRLSQLPQRRFPLPMKSRSSKNFSTWAR